MLSFGFNLIFFIYNVLLKSLSKNQDGRVVEELLMEMKSEGIIFNDSIYCFVVEVMFNLELGVEKFDN